MLKLKCLEVSEKVLEHISGVHCFDLTDNRLLQACLVNEQRVGGGIDQKPEYGKRKRRALP